MVNTPLDILAQTARKTREARGLSQMELANRLSMNSHTIMDFEGGRSNPKAETILLVSRELEISLDAIIFAGTDKPNAVSTEMLDFFSGKSDEEAKRYIEICRLIEALHNKENGQ